MTNEIDKILKFDPAVSNSQKGKQIDAVSEILKFDPGGVQAETKSELSDNQIASGERLTWKQALVDGFQNIPSSAWEFGKNIVDPFISPVQTAKTIGKVALGGGEKLVSGKQENEQYFDAVVDFYKERYGSVDGFKQAVAKDPVGILSDLASVVTGTGSVVKATGTAGKLGKVASVGSAIEKTGAAIEPLNVARGIAGVPLRLVPESFPIGQFQSAVKFGTTLSQKERDEVTRTALKASNQIMPTSNGMQKLREMINGYNEEISELVNQSTHTGAKVSTNKLFRGLNNVRDQFKRISDEPKTWDAAFNGVKKQWEEALKLGPNRTPSEVQQIKTRIYKDLESFYEKQKATPAKVELRKAIARNSREALEGLIPEIKQLNKNEGALIELWDAVESKANRITNRDLIGIGLPVKMGTGSGIGYMFGGPKGAAIGTSLGFMLGVYDTPQVKAKIALVLNRLREKGITIKPTTAAARLGLYQVGNIEEATEE